MSENLTEKELQEIRETNRHIRMMMRVAIYTSFALILFIVIDLSVKYITRGFL